MAGLLLVASGLGLCLRVKMYPAGGLFASAGALLILAGVPPAGVDTAHAGVAAMALLTAAIAAYPRLTRDLASALTLAGALLGTTVLAWHLERADGLSVGDLAW
ncbi:MAG: hypothetical protein ACK4V6_20950, partial [Microthrixaceae bacterium]